MVNTASLVRQPLWQQALESCEPVYTAKSSVTSGRTGQPGAPEAIRTRLVNVIAELETVEAMISAEGLRPEADSLATVIADLQWQCEELGGVEVPVCL